ncbi:MAG: glutathione S-transferase family protein [Conexibacter sp.]
MPHTLYIIHGSHPCVAAERALQLKGQPYRIHEMAPTLHVPEQWLRFRKTTVPALVLGSGERIVGSRAIVHRLDELVPEPPLLPQDAAARTLVEEAERWGDEVLQPIARRLFWTGLRACPDALGSYAEGSKLPVPAPLRKLITPVMSRLAAARNKASAAQARADLAELPGQLDRVDGWIAEGILGGEQLNAADLQIGPSLRMLATFGDVRPQMEGRPCLALSQRVVPEYTGYMPVGALPA